MGIHGMGSGGLMAGLMRGITDGIIAEAKNTDFWTGNKWVTTEGHKLPGEGLQIHKQSNKMVGCTQETFESISEYLGNPIIVEDKTQGADLFELAKKYGYSERNVLTIPYGETYNAKYLGLNLDAGRPMGLTYNPHTVGINGINFQEVKSIFGITRKISVQIMNPRIFIKR